MGSLDAARRLAADQGIGFNIQEVGPPVGTLGYSSSAGDLFREWLDDLARASGVDLSTLEFDPTLDVYGTGGDYPSFGSLRRSRAQVLLAYLDSVVWDDDNDPEGWSDSLRTICRRVLRSDSSDLVTMLA